MSKKTILMLPTWYPTKENPFNGCFFREQAIALLPEFDFVVATYHTRHQLALLYYLKKFLHLNNPRVTFVQNDEGLQEYAITAEKPQFIIWDMFTERFSQVVLHKTNRDGVGKVEHHSLKNQRRFVASFIRKKNLLPHFDCVYSLTSQNYASLGKCFADEFSVPHVTAEHGPFPWPGTVLTDSTVEAIETADAFLAISNDKIRQVLLQNIHVNPVWVGNLCDETRFSLAPEKHDVPTFLIVAATSFFKNYPLFMQAMEELKRMATKPFKIIIAGYNSNKGYSTGAAALEGMVRNSVIKDMVTMIEAVPRQDMPALYNSVDAFVMTSIQEGLPVSAIEAAMSGLPVFSTRCGGVEDYVDESMGRIFAITDAEGIARACNAFIDGELTFDNAHIREQTVSLFGTQAFRQRMSAVFHRVMDKE